MQKNAKIPKKPRRKELFLIILVRNEKKERMTKKNNTE